LEDVLSCRVVLHRLSPESRVQHNVCENDCAGKALDGIGNSRGAVGGPASSESTIDKARKEHALLSSLNAPELGDTVGELSNVKRSTPVPSPNSVVLRGCVGCLHVLSI